MLKSIDILIGVSVVMLVASMAVTLLTHIVTTFSNSRGHHLGRGLADILQQIDPRLTKDIATKISKTVLTHPLVNDVSKRLGTVIHREEFTKILMDLASGNGPQRLAPDVKDVLFKVIQEHGIPDPAKALNDIRARALALEQSNPDLANDVRTNLAIMQEAGSQFVAKIHGWFDQTIDRVSVRFTASTRIITCVIALFVAFTIQLDSIALINRLGTDPELRKTLLTEANELQENPPAAGQPQQLIPDAKGIGQNLEVIDQALESRGLLSLPEWKKSELCGLLPVWRDFSFQKLVGVLLTAALLSFGAPFWYDTLQKALRLRSVIAGKDDDQRQERQTTQLTAQQPGASAPSGSPSPGALAGEGGDLKAVG